MLADRDLSVCGTYLAGANDGTFFARVREWIGVSKGPFRDTRCFISTGEKDNLVSKSHVGSVVSSLRAGGVRDIREEWFEGDHGMNREHITEGLQWFTESLTKKK
ncbi:MAG: hypothetical protein ACKO2G_12225 [Verrucomicrobiales bacterium]